MGKIVVAVPLDGETVAYAEVDAAGMDTEIAGDPEQVQDDADDLEPVVRNVPKQLHNSVKDAMQAVVRPTADVIFGQLRESVHAPSQVELEFGLKLNAKLGTFFAETSAEGHIQVKLTWMLPLPVKDQETQ
jgi:Trypsin-co-occurring domain 1